MTDPNSDHRLRLSPEHISARYRLWLSSTLMLALATVTLSVVVLIITDARERTREEDFEATLTAVWEMVGQEAATHQITPTPPPPIAPGIYPFAARPGDPAYAPAETCTVQLLNGLILDAEGEPLDSFVLRVWGDFARAHSLFTGDRAGEAPGAWSLAFSDSLNRRVWVQVMEGERYVSAPVEVVFNRGDCSRNHAEISFVQVAPGR